MEKKQRKNSNVLINSEYLRAFIKSTGKTKREFGESLGRTESYIDNCVHRGYVQSPVLNLMLSIYNPDVHKLIVPKDIDKSKESKPAASNNDELLTELVNAIVRIERKIDKLLKSEV